MDDIVLMDILKSIKDLQVYVDGLLERERLGLLLVLEVVKIAEVAVLHHQEVPFPFCVRDMGTFKGFEQFDYIWMIKHGHCVDFLQ